MIDTSLPPLLLTSHAALGGDDRSIRRRYERGELVRVRSGAYVTTAAWAALDYDARYRLQVVATASAVQHGTQFSHDSAAALWRLPTIGPWSKHVHLLVDRAIGGRSSSTIRRHAVGVERSPVTINEVTLTSLSRTVVDIACTSDFIRAVTMVDSALRVPEPGEPRHDLHCEYTTKAALVLCLDELAPYVGSVRALRAISFGNGQSGSVGESLSRAQMHLLRFPAPLLQVPFYDEEGFIGYADFYWPELGLIGEFDGDVKYKNKTYLRGRLPEDVVIAEKRREDRLRRVSRAFVRWDWPTALDRRLLAQRLAPFGLMPSRNY